MTNPDTLNIKAFSFVKQTIEDVSKIDTNNPILESVQNNPTDWTNQSITITVKGKDLESGIQSIIRPDGSSILGGQTNYSIHKNGDYLFILKDLVGNETTAIVKVTRVDKQLPSESTIYFQK